MNWIQLASLSFIASVNAPSRDLARAGRLVARDHVVHVVTHVVRGGVRVGARHGDLVAAVELDVRVPERALGQVVQRFEPLRELEIGFLDPEVVVAERRLGELGEALGVEPVEVLGRTRASLRRPIAVRSRLVPSKPNSRRVVLDALDLRR